MWRLITRLAAEGSRVGEEPWCVEAEDHDGRKLLGVGVNKAIAALEQHGGTVIKTSLSDEDAKKLQDALQPSNCRRVLAW